MDWPARGPTSEIVTSRYRLTSTSSVIPSLPREAFIASGWEDQSALAHAGGQPLIPETKAEVPQLNLRVLFI